MYRDQLKLKVVMRVSFVGDKVPELISHRGQCRVLSLETGIKHGDLMALLCVQGRFGNKQLGDRRCCYSGTDWKG